jgi:hypothetical protein
MASSPFSERRGSGAGGVVVAGHARSLESRSSVGDIQTKQIIAEVQNAVGFVSDEFQGGFRRSRVSSFSSCSVMQYRWLIAWLLWQFSLWV